MKLTTENYFKYCDSIQKLTSLAYIINTIWENDYKHIISFGSGIGKMEYLLKSSIKEDCIINCLEKRDKYIKICKNNYPTLNTFKFDMNKDKVMGNYDVALFFNSSQYMNNAIYIQLLERLYELGIEIIFDLTGCFKKEDMQIVNNGTRHLRTKRNFRKIFRKYYEQEFCLKITKHARLYKLIRI